MILMILFLTLPFIALCHTIACFYYNFQTLYCGTIVKSILSFIAFFLIDGYQGSMIRFSVVNGWHVAVKGLMHRTTELMEIYKYLPCLSFLTMRSHGLLFLQCFDY